MLWLNCLFTPPVLQSKRTPVCSARCEMVGIKRVWYMEGPDLPQGRKWIEFSFLWFILSKQQFSQGILYCKIKTQANCDDHLGGLDERTFSIGKNDKLASKAEHLLHKEKRGKDKKCCENCPLYGFAGSRTSASIKEKLANANMTWHEVS